MKQLHDERIKQVAVGVSLILTLTGVVLGLLLGWRSLPGLLGEWLGFMLGIMTTPFLLETTFVILGLIIVISLNTWRRQQEGDEFVQLDESPSLESTAKSGHPDSLDDKIHSR